MFVFTDVVKYSINFSVSRDWHFTLVNSIKKQLFNIRNPSSYININDSDKALHTSLKFWVDEYFSLVFRKVSQLRFNIVPAKGTSLKFWVDEFLCISYDCVSDPQ